MTRAIRHCRACGSRSLEAALDLGSVPLANALLARDDVDAPRHPLSLLLCGACALVQLEHSVPAETLFSDYVYFSSYSDTMVAHARRVVLDLVRDRRLGADDFIVEVASNDGYLLQHYVEAGVPVLGVEPAANVAEVARQERAIPTWCRFFDSSAADEILTRHGPASVVHAHNVLAHVDGLAEFVDGLARLLRPAGVLVVEVPYLQNLVARCQFDTIYHEHLSYFGLLPLQALFGRHGLTVSHVEHVSVHGGSLRVFATRAADHGSPSQQVLECCERERATSLGCLETYASLGERIERRLAELSERIAAGESSSGGVAAYGAAAKGVMLLNHLGDRARAIRYVVDRSPHKVGKFVPGPRTPIVGTEALTTNPPASLLVLPWNIAEEIVSQQSEFERRGGHFIVPDFGLAA